MAKKIVEEPKIPYSQGGKMVFPDSYEPTTPATVEQAHRRAFNRKGYEYGGRIGDLYDWLRDIPEEAHIGLLIEDEVVEIRPYDDYYTYGYFCLASGASSSKRVKKNVP